MTSARKRRLALVAFLLVGVGVAAALALAAFERNIMFFYTPAQIANAGLPAGAQFRLGGIVVPGSFERIPDSLRVRFAVTDGSESVVVAYEGLLPDLFREGKGVVALGSLAPDGTVEAVEILAKHDENYLPQAVADALADSVGADRAREGR